MTDIPGPHQPENTRPEMPFKVRYVLKSNKPRHEKTGLRGFRPGPTQTRLYNHRRYMRLKISGLGSRGIVLSL